MSLVVPMDEDMATGLGTLVLYSNHIVELKSLDEKQLYYEKTFPKETHYNKSEETVYQEFVYKYIVQSVLKSPNLKPGDKIWLKGEEAYTEDSYQMSHEQGIEESPIIDYYYSKYDEKDGSYYFLTDMSDGKMENVYHHYINATEGLEGKNEIEKLLSETFEDNETSDFVEMPIDYEDEGIEEN